jgi:O-antigen ligase
MQVSEQHDERRYLTYFGAILCLAYLIPLHVNPYPSFYNEWAISLGVFILILGFMHRSQLPMRLPSIAMLPVIVAVMIGIQILAGLTTFPWDGALAIGYCLLAGISILIGATIAAEDRGSERLCATVAWSHLIAAGLSVVIATMQLAGGEHIFVPFAMLMAHSDAVIRPHANIAQTNQLALLFCMGIASVWWLFQNDRVGPLVAISLLVSLIWGLSLTQSRIAWMILPAFSMLVFIWRWKSGLKLIPSIVIIGFLLLYFLFAFALPEISSMFGSQVDSPAARVNGGYSIRLVLLQQAWEMSLTHPLFGVGWYEFGPQQVAIASQFEPGTYARHSHNLVLNFAAEFGWLFTLALMGWMIWWLKALISKTLNSQTCLFFLFAVAIGLHSMVEFPLWYAYVLFPFCLLIGMAHQNRLGSALRMVSRPIVFTVALTGLSMLMLLAVDYRKAANAVTQMEFSAMGIAVGEQKVERPVFTIFPHLYAYFDFLAQPLTTEVSQEEITAMEKIGKRFAGVLMLTRMSQVYAINGQTDEAIATMKTIQHLHPASYAGVYKSWSQAPEAFQSTYARMPAPRK